jgi:hypothetical protein
VEDRLTPGLHLERFDDPLDDYVSERVPAMLRRDGVTRATWWENLRPERDDLPRVLPEYTHLAVYEVEPGFTPPPPPPKTESHHFVRTSRPGQGTISGQPTIGLSLVLISPKEEERATELRDWADFVHIRHIAEAAVPGYTMITPYVNAEPGAHPRFMHFYEMDCDDPEAAYRSMTPLVTARFGGRHDYWRHWAFGPSLRIMYVNSFRRVGASS